MSNRDPFSDKSSPFGKNRPGANPQPSENKTPPVTPSFPSRTPQGGSVPPPTRPVFPSVPKQENPAEKPAQGSSLPEQPKFTPPAFKQKQNLPRKGSAEDLFPSLTQPVTPAEEETEVEVPQETPEATVAEVYEEIFGEPLEGSEEDYDEVTLEEEDRLDRYQAAADPDAAMSSLYSLATDTDLLTRLYVATNENTPTVLLERLAKDPEPEVREGVMENENCPTPLYRTFVSDDDDFVVASFIDNPRTTADMVNVLHATNNPFLAQKLIESDLVSDAVKTRLRTVIV